MRTIFKLLRYFLRNEKGSTMVIIAGGMVVFLAFTALVVDLGFLYFERRNMQNAADAAALASAFHLPGNINNHLIIVDTAEDYASYHGYNNGNDSTVLVSNPNGNIRQVEVVIQRDVPLFFARTMGFSSRQVAAGAVAAADAPGLDIMPFTMLEYAELTDAVEEELKVHGGILKPYLFQYGAANKPSDKTKVFIRFFENDILEFSETGENNSWLELHWRNNKTHFCYALDYLIQIREEGEEGFDDLADDFSTWFRVGNVPGNWGLLDLSDFKDGGGHSVESVLMDGLDYGICNEVYISVSGATIDNKPGQNQNIQAARGALEYRIAEQNGVGWIILILPELVDKYQGKERDIPRSDFIFAKIEGMDPDLVQDDIVAGYLTGVYCGDGCPDITGTSMVGVYLIR